MPQRKAMTRSLALAVAAALPAGCGPTPATAPTDPPVEYAGWPALTAEPVKVSRELFYFCSVPAEARRLGPHFVPSARYYASPDAADAVRRGDAPLPVGAKVLKVKRWTEDDGSESGPPSYALMTKREPGYDPAHGDWEYLYATRAADGGWAVERGRLDSCIDCHAQAKATDHLFRTYLKK